MALARAVVDVLGLCDRQFVLCDCLVRSAELVEADGEIAAGACFAPLVASLAINGEPLLEILDRLEVVAAQVGVSATPILPREVASHVRSPWARQGERVLVTAKGLIVIPDALIGDTEDGHTPGFEKGVGQLTPQPLVPVDHQAVMTPQIQAVVMEFCKYACGGVPVVAGAAEIKSASCGARSSTVFHASRGLRVSLKYSAARWRRA